MEKAIINENMITGILVPRANTGAKNNPPLDFKTKGIKAPKNNTPLYGQNAKAKSTPSKNDPIYPFLASHSFIFSVFLLPLLKFIFITPNIISPISIKIGPNALSP